MMFCPSCGKQGISEAMSFCSGCGFRLGVERATDFQPIGNPYFIPETIERSTSTRIKGLKQGGKMILSGLILVPLLGILSNYLRIELIVALTALITFWGGILRMVFALIFEGNEELTLVQKTRNAANRILKKNRGERILPPGDRDCAANYVPPGSWRETGEFSRQSQNHRG